MHKWTLLLAVLAVAAMPSVADAAKKGKKAAKAAPAPAAQAIPEPPIIKFFLVGASTLIQPLTPQPAPAAKGTKGKKK